MTPARKIFISVFIYLSVGAAIYTEMARDYMSECHHNPSDSMTEIAAFMLLWSPFMTGVTVESLFDWRNVKISVCEGDTP